jgi:hypothetical protein
VKSPARIVLVVAMALLLGDIGVLATGVGGSDNPSKWDPRVADLASYVENARHLRFDHPVKVRFLTEKQYTDESRDDAAELTQQDKADIANEEGELRALGLLKKGVSLFDDTNTLTSSGTLAFYDPGTEQMVIRGTALTIGTKVTVVHELTHALQDQHFDLGRTFNSETRSEFFHSLGEGDASRVERMYIDALNDTDAKAFFDEQTKARSGAISALADVSPFLTQYFGAPYDLGEPLTSVVVATKGEAGLNALFRNPPASDETLLDPFALLDGARPTRIARPRMLPGERVTHAGDFGALRWYLMLATFIDEKVALRATDGWNGDAFAAYRKAGRSCVRATFLGDTDKDTQEMHDALQQWKAAFSADAVTVARAGDRVDFDSCEPATSAAPRAGSAESLSLPTARFALVNEVLTSGGTEKLARCAVPELINRLTVKQLNPQTEKEAAPIQALVPVVARNCRRQGQA